MLLVSVMYLLIHALLLLLCLGLLIRLALQPHKQLIHLLFAAFTASLAMMAVKRLSADDVGAYQYLLGMGVCMTCNGYWLIARVMFRHDAALSWRHWVAAGVIALFVIMSQGLALLTELKPAWQLSTTAFSVLLREVLNLLSSTVLLLTAWEACRGLAQSQGKERRHRYIFLACYISALTSSMLIAKLWLNDINGALMMQMLAAGSGILVLLVTQWLIQQRFAQPSAGSRGHLETKPLEYKTINTEDVIATEQVAALTLTETTALRDEQLAIQLQQLLITAQVFLQPNLRLTDLAKQLDVPEYRVSRVLRHQFNASNFNQFINHLRVEHAKTLLLAPHTQQWPVLVIGLESGFASAGPFTRAFKSFVGTTPHEFRQTQLRN